MQGHIETLRAAHLRLRSCGYGSAVSDSVPLPVPRKRGSQVAREHGAAPPESSSDANHVIVYVDDDDRVATESQTQQNVVGQNELEYLEALEKFIMVGQ